MREILFRGKRLDNGEWVYGWLVHDKIRERYSIIRDKDWSNWDIDKETISQYTGLTDKNGRKIFEGDIITSYDTRSIIIWDEDEAVFMEEFIDGKLKLLIYRPFLSREEVVGNKWDNPKLLKEKCNMVRTKIDPLDIVGKKFGRLTVIEYTGKNGKMKYRHYYKCRCECGNVIEVERHHLMSGQVRSCGCLKHDVSVEKGKKRRRTEEHICEFCGENIVYAKGLCRNCYMRMYNHGTCEYLQGHKNQPKREHKKFYPDTEFGKILLRDLESGATTQDLMNKYNISLGTIYYNLKKRNEK